VLFNSNRKNGADCLNSWIIKQLVSHRNGFPYMLLAVMMFEGPIICWKSGWRMLGAAQERCGGRALTFLRYLDSWERTAQWSHKIKSFCLRTHFGIKCPSDQQEFPP
jgi:hypothetical protein